MSSRKLNLVLIILFIINIGMKNVDAEAPRMGAPAPAMDCMTPIYNMSDCLSYVSVGSNASKPDKACCPELAGLLESNPICLCHLLGSGNSSDIPISLDINRALKLPKLCALQTPPVSMCSEIGIPVAVPTSSEAPSSAPTSSYSTAPGTPTMAPSPGAGMDCMTPIYNMSDCLTYVSIGSNTSKPDKACCPELAGLLESNPICLCHLLGKSSPISLDVNRALKLPKACGLQTPPVSLCSEIGIPVGVPTSSQAPSGAPTSTTSSDSTAPGMSPMTPSAEEGATPKNGVSRTYTNLSFIIASLAIAFASLSTF